jgi:ATPase family AAA domain-containing protein 1
MLKDTPLDPDFPMHTIADRSIGFSGSDLKELCRNAAMMPVRDYVRETGENPALLAKGQLEVCIFLKFAFPLSLLKPFVQGFKLRPLSISDFFDSDSVVLPLRSEDRSTLEIEETD